ncbi:hypothetical protein MPER_08505 [Moniliophthora perniciosa FA553]|nr:hypothetical protein MPER_08505 [Moniliophthora perniciosa FA553]
MHLTSAEHIIYVSSLACVVLQDSYCKSQWAHVEGRYGLPNKQPTDVPACAAWLPNAKVQVYTLPREELIKIVKNLREAKEAAGVGTYYQMSQTLEAPKALLFHNLILQVAALFKPAVISVPETTILGTAKSDFLEPRGPTLLLTKVFTLGGITIILAELKKNIIAIEGLAQLFRQMESAQTSNRKLGIQGKVFGILSDGGYFFFSSLDSNDGACFTREAEYRFDATDADAFDAGILPIVCHIFSIILDAMVSAVKTISLISKRRGKVLLVSSLMHRRRLIGEEAEHSTMQTRESFATYSELNESLQDVVDTLSLCPVEHQTEATMAITQLKQISRRLGKLIPGVKELPSEEVVNHKINRSATNFLARQRLSLKLSAAQTCCKEGKTVDMDLLKAGDIVITLPPATPLASLLLMSSELQEYLKSLSVNNADGLSKLRCGWPCSASEIDLGAFLELRCTLSKKSLNTSLCQEPIPVSSYDRQSWTGRQMVPLSSTIGGSVGYQLLAVYFCGQSGLVDLGLLTKFRTWR